MMLAKRNLSALSAMAMLVCWVCVAAQTPSQRTVPPSVSSEEPAVGSISGAVVTESGQPLAGAIVYVRNISPIAGTARSATTDSDGTFEVKGLERALYTVSTYVPAYVTRPSDPGTTPTHYRIGDSVRLELVRGAVITGTVTNAAGEPLIGVRVRAIMVRNAKGEPARFGTFAFQERTTDDRGIYRIFGMPAGTYLINAGGAGNSQTFILNPYDSDVPTYAPSSTRDSAMEITVRAGEETTVDVRYRGEPGHSVSGTVKMSTSTNASIALIPVGSVIAIATANQMPTGRGFAFYGIGDGEYDVVAQEVRSAVGAIPDLLRSEPRRITVKGADVSGIELVTKPLAAIRGRFVLEPAKLPECEGKRRPLFGEMLVVVQQPEKSEDKDTSPFLRPLTSPVPPDANGDFVLRNLWPSRYLLEPRFYAKYWYLNSISIAATPKVDAAANWTTVKSGDQLANFTITLTEGAASIRGRVTAANAADIPTGLGIYLVPAEREKVADVLRYFVTSVGTAATFAFNNLPPGRYLVLTQTIDAQTNTLNKLRLPEAAEARTKLRRAAEAQKIDLALKPCQNLTDYQLAMK
jgi:hypothetical protein